jgi:hypothetical protein
VGRGGLEPSNPEAAPWHGRKDSIEPATNEMTDAAVNIAAWLASLTRLASGL